MHSSMCSVDAAQIEVMLLTRDTCTSHNQDGGQNGERLCNILIVIKINYVSFSFGAAYCKGNRLRG